MASVVVVRSSVPARAKELSIFMAQATMAVPSDRAAGAGAGAGGPAEGRPIEISSEGTAFMERARTLMESKTPQVEEFLNTVVALVPRVFDAAVSDSGAARCWAAAAVVWPCHCRACRSDTPPQSRNIARVRCLVPQNWRRA